MNERDAIWRRCKDLAYSIDVPDPYSVEALCEMLSQRRGRPIRIAGLPHDVPAGKLCGGWIRLPYTDVILVEERTSQVHREQIVLHELAHMLCGHQEAPVAPESTLNALLTGQLTHLRSAAIGGMLARTAYNDLVEQEAELVATFLADRIAELKNSPRPLATNTLRQITHVFGGPPPSGGR